MGKFNMLLPAPLRPENGAVRQGDNKAGFMVTRGHKFAPGATFQEAQIGLASNPEDQSGTTATVAVCTEDTLTLAYVGDSRACVIKADGSAVFLTGAHRPSDKAEKARIIEQGGFVTEPSGPDDVHRVNGIYAVSRCLGNVGAAGTVGLSQEPEIVVHSRQPEDSILLVASDGVWDFLKLSTVAKVAMAAANRGEDMAGVALAVVKRAYAMRSNDDIAVFVARLDAPTAPDAAPATIPAYHAPPAVALSTVAPPAVVPPAAVPSTVTPPAEAPPIEAPPVVAPPAVAPPAVAPPVVAPMLDTAHLSAWVRAVAQPQRACSAVSSDGAVAELLEAEVPVPATSPRAATNGRVGWRLGRVLRWGVTLAAAAAGAAVIASRRR